MTSLATIQLDNAKLTAEKQPTSGCLADTAKTWFEGTAGAYDFMKALNKVSILFGLNHLTKQTNGYIAGTAVLRVVPTAVTLQKTYQAAGTIKDEKLAARKIERQAAFVHNCTDFGAMLCYTKAFFTQTPTFCLKLATWFNVANDLTDVVTSSSQIHQANDRKTKLAAASPVIQRANINSLNYALLKLIKAVTGFVTSFFACLALVVGTAFIAPKMAALIGLTSAFFNIAAYYHKNYYCNSSLRVEYLAVK